MNKPFNRIKIVLAEKRLRSKELAEKLNVTESTVSRWCSNESQPKPEMFIEIANTLDVDVRELIVSTKN
jgi:transcriptional regulator with XRE-family HTH domain